MSQSTPQLDVLFLSEGPIWPLDQGYRIRGYHMARALRQLGVRAAVASLKSIPEEAPRTAHEMIINWPSPSATDVYRFHRGWSGAASWFRKRLARHQAIHPRRLAGAVTLVRRHRPMAVIGLGQHSPMMLQGLRLFKDLKRIWYAADEPLHFHLSCLRTDRPTEVPMRLWKMLVYTALEACFVRNLDGAIGVNPKDTQWLRWVGGVRDAMTIRNGVDLDYFSPGPAKSRSTCPESLVFWGRLDFEPNIDALTWFGRHVWPTLHAAHPDARWHIIGKNPTPPVARVASLPGVYLRGNVSDIRPIARASSVAIMPMRCGGGIKNKLLEAAAMARPIIASGKALQGLDINTDRQPALTCETPVQWSRTIQRLWSNPRGAARLGEDALQWAKSYHTWPRAARSLRLWLASMLDHQASTLRQPSSRISGSTTRRRGVAIDPIPLQSKPTRREAA